MKKNGFTLVEILISFSLSSIVMVLLLNIVLLLKDLYVEDGMKTMLLINQANFNKRLEDELSKNEVTEISSCGESCLTFNFLNGSTKTLSYNQAENALTFDNYKAELVKGTKVGVFKAQTKTITTISNPSYNNSILSIEIPITHNLIDGEFGVNFIYPYNSHVTVVSVT